jgi:hypothetical protein
MDATKAVAGLERSLAELAKERASVLGVIDFATKTGNGEVLMEYAGQLAAVRKLYASASMAVTAYRSGVKSAAILACLMQVYIDLPETDKPLARAELVRAFALFGAEATAASERTVTEANTAKVKAGEDAKRAADATAEARARRRMALRQEAFNKSSALWRAFHTVYHITDADIEKLFPGAL